MRVYGHFLLFVSFFLFYSAGSIYVAWRLVSGFRVAPPHSRIVYWSFFIMAAVATVAFYFSTYNINFFISFLGPLGGIWMGMIGIAAGFLLANDILNLANLRFGFFNRQSFLHYSTLVAAVLSLLLCAWALFNAASILKVKEIHLKVPGLKTDKVSVVLLADMHITNFTAGKNIQKIVEISNGLDPDIVVIGGDLLDTDVSETYALYGLDKLRAKYGIFAVTGNHEYYAGIKYCEDLCKSLNIKLLRNESFDIENVITVAGINDKYGAKVGVDKFDIPAAFAAADKNSPVLFISHRPEAFAKASNMDFNIVQLSGHVHAGQIPPVEIILRIFKKYFWGLYSNNGSYMYVTSGARWWRSPMRAFNYSEIVKIVLERE
ncbi:MAG: metallophosphoesterase [Endomicrobia bacterium]|nr:metallophosphoesterase [Endomicrobiia bacterium]